MNTKTMQIDVNIVSGYEGRSGKKISVIECSHSGCDCLAQDCPCWGNCCSKGRMIKFEKKERDVKSE